MKIFALILSVMNLEGTTSTFVISYDMTIEDCQEMKNVWEENLDMYSTVECE